MALASSVTASPARSSASHQHARCGTSAASAPATCRRGPGCARRGRPRRALSVSGSACASRPPTSSCSQASIRASISVGVIRQRAASCTSTQSCVGRRRRVLSSQQPVAHAGGARGAADRSRHRPAPGSVDCARRSRRRAPPPPRCWRCGRASARRPPGCARPSAGRRCARTAWARAVPARLPVPAQGIRAIKTGSDLRSVTERR